MRIFAAVQRVSCAFGGVGRQAELGGEGPVAQGEAPPRNLVVSGPRTPQRGRWVRLCAFPVLCGVGAGEETLGAPGTRSGVRLPCPVWARTLATRWGAPGTGSLSPQRWRGRCADKGFRDAALRGEAAPGQAAKPGASQLSTAAAGDHMVACRGSGLGTPKGPVPKLGAGMPKYGACARLRAGRKKRSHPLTRPSCLSWTAYLGGQPWYAELAPDSRRPAPLVFIP